MKENRIYIAAGLAVLLAIMLLNHQSDRPAENGPGMCYANGYGWMKQPDCDKLVREGKVKP